MNFKWDIFKKLYPEISIFFSLPPTPHLAPFTPNIPRTYLFTHYPLSKRRNKRTKTHGLLLWWHIICSPQLRHLLLFIPLVSLLLVILWVTQMPSLPAREAALCFPFYNQCCCYCIGLCSLNTRSLLLSSSLQLMTIIKQSLRLLHMMSTLLRLFGCFCPIFSVWSKTDPWVVS